MRKEKINVNDEIFISPETTSDNDFKMSLLVSLYSQVEFLKSEMEEKNLLIRTLLMKESDVYNYNNSEHRHTDTDNGSISSDQPLMNDELTVLSDEIINTLSENLSSENVSSNQFSTPDVITSYPSNENSILINRGLIQDVTSGDDSSSFEDTYSSSDSESSFSSQSMVSEDELINTIKKNIEIQLMQVRDKHESFLNATGNEQMCKNGTSDGVEKNNSNNNNNNSSSNNNSSNNNE